MYVWSSTDRTETTLQTNKVCAENWMCFTIVICFVNTDSVLESVDRTHTFTEQQFVDCVSCLDQLYFFVLFVWSALNQLPFLKETRFAAHWGNQYIYIYIYTYRPRRSLSEAVPYMNVAGTTGERATVLMVQLLSATRAKKAKPWIGKQCQKCKK